MNEQDQLNDIIKQFDFEGLIFDKLDEAIAETKRLKQNPSLEKNLTIFLNGLETARELIKESISELQSQVIEPPSQSGQPSNS